MKHNNLHILILIIILAGFDAFAGTTHLFYCNGSNEFNNDFIEVQFQRNYQGEMRLSRILVRELPDSFDLDDIQLAFEEQDRFPIISDQKVCPRNENFPLMCKTDLDRSSKNYHYTFVDIGYYPSSVSDYSLKNLVKAGNSQNARKYYSYGKFDRETIGRVKKCAYAWAVNR